MSLTSPKKCLLNMLSGFPAWIMLDCKVCLFYLLLNLRETPISLKRIVLSREYILHMSIYAFILWTIPADDQPCWLAGISRWRRGTQQGLEKQNKWVSSPKHLFYFLAHLVWTVRDHTFPTASVFRYSPPIVSSSSTFHSLTVLNL